MPEHDADLPRRPEAGIERGGQMLKRRQADAELILARWHGREGRGVICRGTTPFTFKTVFGTVQVRRRRIEHKADSTTEIPSAHAWQTPRQVALTPGLRDAACDGMLRDSAQQTVARIDTRAGESGVLAKTTVLEIVHQEGQQLQAAARARAAAIYARDPEALQLFVPATSPEEEDDEPGGLDDGVGEAEAEATPTLIGSPGSPTDHPEVKRDHPREVDPGVVLVELDEVKVHAQAHTHCKQVLALTALVMIEGRCWHLVAATTQRLAYQGCRPTTHREAFSVSASCSFRRLGPTAHRRDWCRSWRLFVEGRVVPSPLVSVSSTVSDGRPARLESLDLPAIRPRPNSFLTECHLKSNPLI